MTDFVQLPIFSTIREQVSAADLATIESLIQRSPTLQALLLEYNANRLEIGGLYDDIKIDLPGAAQHNMRDTPRFVSVDPESLANPVNMVATLAHELGHFADRVRFANAWTLGYQMGSGEEMANACLITEGRAINSNIQVAKEILASSSNTIRIPVWGERSGDDLIQAADATRSSILTLSPNAPTSAVDNAVAYGLTLYNEQNFASGTNPPQTYIEKCTAAGSSALQINNASSLPQSFLFSTGSSTDGKDTVVASRRSSSNVELGTLESAFSIEGATTTFSRTLIVGQSAIGLDSDLQFSRVWRIDGGSLGQAQGEAIAGDLRARNVSAEMVLQRSPWQHGVLSASNPGLSQPPPELTGPKLTATALVGGATSEDRSVISAINGALNPLTGATTENQVSPDASTDLGVVLTDLGCYPTATYWAGVAAAELGLSGFGAASGLTRASVVQGGGSGGNPEFTLGTAPVFTYSGPTSPLLGQTIVESPSEVPANYSYVHANASVGQSVYIPGVGHFDGDLNSVAIGEETGQPLGVVDQTDYSYEPFANVADGDAWVAPWNGNPDMPSFPPVVLDLDGNGFADLAPLSSSTARFDISGDGVRDRVAWAGPNDGLLVYDHDRNGIATRADELSFMLYKSDATSDLEGLRAFDTNTSGTLDADDALFGSFGVWRDANQDGTTQAGEFRSLSEAGIASIGLTGSGGPATINGVTVHNYSTYTTTGSVSRSVADVGFQYSAEAPGQAQGVSMPVVALDLDGDGVHKVAKADSGVIFDVDNDGFLEGADWIDSGDGVLALDWNGDGRISSASELATTNAAEVSNAGANRWDQLDSNQDGVLTSGDARFDDLVVWRDANGNGITDDFELRSLVALGITDLDLSGGTYSTAEGATWTLDSLAFDADALGTEISATPFGIRLRSEDGSSKLFTKYAGGLLVEDEAGSEMGRSTFFTSTSVTAAPSVFDITLLGGEDVDALGNALANRLTGNDAINTLDGSGGDDVLDGGAGADELIGGAGNDTYYVDNVGDAIQESSTVTVQSTTYQRTVSGTSEYRYNVIVNGTHVDYILVDVYHVTFTPVTSTTHVPDSGNDSIFASVTYTLPNGVENLTLTGTAASATGNALNNRLGGNSSNNFLYGQAGNDTYLFGLGSGQDYLSDYDASTNNIDVVEVAAGVGPDDFVVTRPSESNHLFLNIRGTTDTVILGDWYVHDGWKVEQVRLADGTLWGSEDFAALRAATEGSDPLTGDSSANVLYGLGGPDTLSGQEGNDKLDGGTGSDFLYGGSGSDTFLFRRGSGQDYVQDYDAGTGVDTFKVGSGINPLDIFVSRPTSTSAHLYLDIRGTSGADRMTLGDWFNDDAGWRKKEALFADGTVWSKEALSALARSTDGNDPLSDDGSGVLYGQGGTDLLSGQDGVDILDGGLGNDFLYGGTGSDTYMFGRGYGQEYVSDYDGASGNLDTVQLTPGVSYSDLRLTRSGATQNGAHLLVDIHGTADRLTLGDWFTDYGWQVEQVRLADGTIISLEDLWTESEGGGGQQSSMQYGGGEEQMMSGGMESSAPYGLEVEAQGTYVFNRGDGEVTIDAADPSTPDTILIGDRIAPDHLWLSRAQNDMVMRVIGTGDALRFKDWYDGPEHQQELLQFADGSYSTTAAQAGALISAMAAFAPPGAGERAIPAEYAPTLIPLIASSWQG